MVRLALVLRGLQGLRVIQVSQGQQVALALLAALVIQGLRVILALLAWMVRQALQGPQGPQGPRVIRETRGTLAFRAYRAALVLPVAKGLRETQGPLVTQGQQVTQGLQGQACQQVAQQDSKPLRPAIPTMPSPGLLRKLNGSDPCRLIPGLVRLEVPIAPGGEAMSGSIYGQASTQAARSDGASQLQTTWTQATYGEVERLPLRLQQAGYG